MIDLKEIRAAAEAANQTKWKAYHDHGWLVVESDDGAVYVKVAKGSFALSPDAKHIATANPAAILALLDRLEAAEKDAARLEGIIKSLEAQVANQQKHLLRQDAELERLRAKLDNQTITSCSIKDEQK